MRPIPLIQRKQINDDTYFKTCGRKKDGGCDGRITIEHAWIYSGRQINEIWAFVPLCWYHHLGPGLNKEKNQWLSICRATIQDLYKYPKKNWLQIKYYLTKKFS